MSPPKVRTKVSSERFVYLVARLYASGMSSYEISQKMNVSEQTVRGWLAALTRYGLKRVNHSKVSAAVYDEIARTVNAEIEELQKSAP